MLLMWTLNAQFCFEHMPQVWSPKGLQVFNDLSRLRLSNATIL
jgi:hypothetical protein